MLHIKLKRPSDLLAFFLIVPFLSFAQSASRPLVSSWEVLTLNSFLVDKARIVKVPNDGSGKVVAQIEVPFGYFGQNLSAAVDLSEAEAVSFEIANKTAEPVTFQIRFESTTVSQKSRPSGLFTIGGEKSARVGFYLKPATSNGPEWPRLKGEYPALPGIEMTVRSVPADRSVLRTIDRWVLQSRSPGAVLVEVSNFQIVDQGPVHDSAVDSFGQNTTAEWAGKVHHDYELKSLSGLFSASRRGGSSADPFIGSPQRRETATRRWRLAESHKNGFTFVTPEGREFWRLGVNHVKASMPTPIGGRESSFVDLPDPSGPLGQFYATQTVAGQKVKSFDFASANLYRKFGPAWHARWVSETRQRLRDWGLNTLSGGFDPEVTQEDIPYEAHFVTSGFPTRMPVPKGYTSIPDPFVAGFGLWLDELFEHSQGDILKRPNVMCVTVDNELHWGHTYDPNGEFDLVEAIFANREESSAKSALVQLLQRRYHDVGSLNGAWQANYSSWSDVGSGGWRAPKNMSSACKQDILDLLGFVADRYYSAVRASLNRTHPGLLYAGSRMGLWGTPDIVVRSASKSVDLLSFNIYSFARTLPLKYLAGLPKPFEITEYGFAAADAGLFPGEDISGVFSLGTQQDRALEATRYLDAIHGLPNSVGASIYCFSDEPLLGREDGENCNFGIVSVTDSVYEPLAKALRSFSDRLYQGRAR